MEFVTQAYSTARHAARIVRELGKKRKYSHFATASREDRSGATPIPCPFTISGHKIKVLD